MAIIRLDCNLNGGDSVTPNNELFYRIYGDVDAYASPIHTTGTALSDANVTVDNDSVIITGVDGSTNTTFKIAAVDDAFNEGVLSDASEESIIIFEDDFAGTTIDTVKWNLINPDTSQVLISQNDELICDSDGSSATVAFDNNLRSDNAFTLSGIGALAFDLTVDFQGNGASWGIGLTKDIVLSSNQDRVSFQKTTASTDVNCIVKEGGVNTLLTTVALDVSTVKTVKIVNSGSAISFNYWNGSAWSQLATSPHTSSGDWYVVIWKDDNTTGNIMTNDNLVLTNDDFTTQRP